MERARHASGHGSGYAPANLAPYLYPNVDRDSDLHAVGEDPDLHADKDSNPNSDGYAHTDAHPPPYVDVDPDAHVHSHAHDYTYAHGDVYGHAYKDPNSPPYLHADVCAGQATRSPG